MKQSENSKLEMARKIEMKKMQDIPETVRPVYHLSSPAGWMNDPNGFSVFEGEYHLFFQYHPYTTSWGPMHWGHSKSCDLIRWEFLSAAMAPDQLYDSGGCYSGSALEDHGRHVLMYTGIIDRYLEDGTHDYRQVQCLAEGDGTDYDKFDGNPVITASHLPEGSSIVDFRDPKIWKEEDGYYLVAGNRAADGCGQILLFHSDNLTDWSFEAVLDSSRGQYGRMWECPDFFPMGNQQILMVSPQDMRAYGYEFHNGNNAIFLYGKYDKASRRFSREKVTSVDYGLDFYAPQTLTAPDGRRIMIGWMQSWDARIMPENFLWSGMMTIPRELTMKNGKIYQTPVKELERYYKNPVHIRDQVITETVSLAGIRGRVLDLQVEITQFDFHHFAIRFARNAEYEMVLQYNHQRKCLTIDRTHSGLVRDVICRRKADVTPMVTGEGREVLRLRLLLDRYSAEVFINDGEKTMSNVFYTPEAANEIVFDTDGTARINVTKYNIQVETG